MKNFWLSLFILGCSYSMVLAQDLISNSRSGQPYPAATFRPKAAAQLIQDRNKLAVKPTPIHLLQFSKNQIQPKFNKWIEDAIFLDLDQQPLPATLQEAPADISFSIPIGQGKEIILDLTQIQVVSHDFIVKTSSGSQNLMGATGLFYTGIVRGDLYSSATLSLFQGQLRLLIMDRASTYILGKIQDDSDQYIFYDEKKLLQDPLPWDCGTKDTPLPKRSTKGTPSPPKPVAGGGCVKVYVETEFQVYQDHNSSLIAVTDYILGIFAESIVAYRNIGVNMEVSELFVWDQNDPYLDQEESGDVLDDFIAERPTFNGDLAHLITTRGIGGGIADGIGSICNAGSPGPHCVSGSLQASFNVSSLPTTSSTFVRVAHEMGHLLGARHTHACVYGPSNDQQIDDCGNAWVLANGQDDDGDCPGDTNMDGCECCAGDTNVDEADEADAAEGSDCFDPLNLVAPNTANGRGTIMSYCHLQTNGRDISNGFHTEVADDINDLYLNADCLTDEDCACEAFVDRTVNGSPIPNGIYSASNSVTSSGQATGGTPQIVVFQAGNQITLEAGFEATELFVAQIVDTLCEAAGSSLIAASQLAEQAPGSLMFDPSSPADSGKKMKIYPNPSRSETFLLLHLEVEGPVEITLHDLNGKRVQVISQKRVLPMGRHQIQVDLRKVVPGIYICKAVINGGVQSAKLVVH